MQHILLQSDERVHNAKNPLWVYIEPLPLLKNPSRTIFYCICSRISAPHLSGVKISSVDVLCTVSFTALHQFYSVKTVTVIQRLWRNNLMHWFHKILQFSEIKILANSSVAVERLTAFSERIKVNVTGCTESSQRNSNCLAGLDMIL